MTEKWRVLNQQLWNIKLHNLKNYSIIKNVIKLWSERAERKFAKLIFFIWHDIELYHELQFFECHGEFALYKLKFQCFCVDFDLKSHSQVDICGVFQLTTTLDLPHISNDFEFRAFCSGFCDFFVFMFARNTQIEKIEKIYCCRMKAKRYFILILMSSREMSKMRKWKLCSKTEANLTLIFSRFQNFNADLSW